MDQKTLDAKNVTLNLTVAELNGILVALGEVPFSKVSQSIALIHKKVQPQIDQHIDLWNKENPAEKVMTDDEVKAKVDAENEADA